MRVRELLSTRFVRFVLVGGLNTALSYGLYLALLAVGLAYPVAIGVSLAASIVIGFLMSGTLVFDAIHPRRFPLYLGSWIIIYLMNVAITAELIAIGIHERWAPLILLPLNVALSYWTQRAIVFRPTSP